MLIVCGIYKAPVNAMHDVMNEKFKGSKTGFSPISYGNILKKWKGGLYMRNLSKKLIVASIIVIAVFIVATATVFAHNGNGSGGGSCDKENCPGITGVCENAGNSSDCPGNDGVCNGGQYGQNKGNCGRYSY